MCISILQGCSEWTEHLFFFIKIALLKTFLKTYNNQSLYLYIYKLPTLVVSLTLLSTLHFSHEQWQAENDKIKRTY